VKQFNVEKGRRGEEIAAEHLRAKGYRIIETNHRTRFGEIDIICKSPRKGGGRSAVFVEVKTKVGEDFGTPEEMISKKKLWQVERTAEMYLLGNPTKLSVRIDAVCIVFDKGGEVARITHYENMTG